MRRFFSPAWAFCLAAVFVPAGALQSINSIVAVVNEDPITRVEIDGEVDRLRKESAAARDAPAPKLRRLALNFLIDRKLQLQQARVLGVQVPPQMVEDRIAEIRRRWGAEEEEMWPLVERKFGLSQQRFRRRVREDILSQAAFYRQVYARIEISEEEVERFLSAEMGVRREYRLRHILVARTPESDRNGDETAKTAAKEILDRIEAGEEFADLARQFSAGEFAAQGGDLGFRFEDDLPAAFAAEAQNLSPGETSRVVETRRGFHLLKLLGKKGGELTETLTRVNIAHLFVEKEDGDKIRALHAQILAGGDFAALVREHSADRRSIADDGGLGWFGEDELPAYFAAAAVDLAAGEVSAPIESPFGWHLLLLRERRVDNLDLEEVRRKAGEVLREKRAEEERALWLRKLRASSYITVLDVELSADEQ